MLGSNTLPPTLNKRISYEKPFRATLIKIIRVIQIKKKTTNTNLFSYPFSIGGLKRVRLAAKINTILLSREPYNNCNLIGFNSNKKLGYIQLSDYVYKLYKAAYFSKALGDTLNITLAFAN